MDEFADWTQRSDSSYAARYLSIPKNRSTPSVMNVFVRFVSENNKHTARSEFPIFTFQFRKLKLHPRRRHATSIMLVLHSLCTALGTPGQNCYIYHATAEINHGFKHSTKRDQSEFESTCISRFSQMALCHHGPHFVLEPLQSVIIFQLITAGPNVLQASMVYVQRSDEAYNVLEWISSRSLNNAG